MNKEEVLNLFPFVCDECGKNVEEDNGNPLDYLCYSCLDERIPK